MISRNRLISLAWILNKGHFRLIWDIFVSPKDKTCQAFLGRCKSRFYSLRLRFPHRRALSKSKIKKGASLRKEFAFTLATGWRQLQRGNASILCTQIPQPKPPVNSHRSIYHKIVYPYSYFRRQINVHRENSSHYQLYLSDNFDDVVFSLDWSFFVWPITNWFECDCSAPFRFPTLQDCCTHFQTHWHIDMLYFFKIGLPNSGRKQSKENKYGNNSSSDDFIFWPLRRNALLQAAADVAQDRWRSVRWVEDRLNHVV